MESFICFSFGWIYVITVKIDPCDEGLVALKKKKKREYIVLTENIKQKKIEVWSVSMFLFFDL